MVAAGFRVHLRERRLPIFTSHRHYDQVVLTCVKNEADGVALPVFSGWYPPALALEVRDVLKELGWFSQSCGLFWPDMERSGCQRSEQQMVTDVEWEDAAKASYPDRIACVSYEDRPPYFELRGKERFFKSLPWHSDFKLDDLSGHAFGERLKLIRRTMRLDLETFYEPSGLTLQTALKWEAGKRKRIGLGEKYITPLCRAFGICQMWLLVGRGTMHYDH
jgi:hypothetical protein